jgi:ATP-dependent Clp protease protease subunit
MSELLEILTDDEKSPLLDKVQKELYKERVLYLNEDISGYTIDNIVPLIKLINIQDEKNSIAPENRKIIELHITSAGGSAYDGFVLLSEIENSVTPIHTYCTGFAMSMALPLFLAGKKRFMGKYCTLLYHELRGGIQGTREEVKRLDKEYDRLQKVYDEFIMSRSSITQDVLDGHQEKVSDWYIDAETAGKYKMYDFLI